MNWLIFINSIIIVSALDSRVFKGDELHPEVHGYLVQLRTYFYEVYDMTGLCSGSIISANWIITAAHCFHYAAVVGVTVLQTDRSGHDTTLATVSVNNIRQHPSYIPNDYTRANAQNDIALLKTDNPILFVDYVRPIKLARFVPRDGDSVIVAGYGDNEFNDTRPREAILHTVSCPLSDLPKSLCTVERPDKARTGEGDSGGPLVSRKRLVGVTTGSFCVMYFYHQPCFGAFTSVAAHFEWIESVTKRHHY